MNVCKHLAAELERALEGGAWHGSSWRELLEETPFEVAAARPVAGAHTIAEIVHHSVTWQEVVRQRLLGEAPQVSDDENWPATAITDEDAWVALRAKLLATGRALGEAVAAFPVERLHEKRPGVDGTWFELILGQLQHMLYHAGQIPMLRMAASP